MSSTEVLGSDGVGIVVARRAGRVCFDTRCFCVRRICLLGSSASDLDDAGYRTVNVLSEAQINQIVCSEQPKDL